MKVVIQKVLNANVVINDEVFNAIDAGFLLLVGIEEGDTQEDLEKAAQKIANLRIFPDEEGKLNLNIHQAKGEILSISQFTLAADCRKGNRPSFTQAMVPEQAKKMFQTFNEKLSEYNLTVKEGVFQEHMNININNDGPTTIILNIRDGKVI